MPTRLGKRIARALKKELQGCSFGVVVSSPKRECLRRRSQVRPPGCEAKSAPNTEYGGEPIQLKRHRPTTEDRGLEIHFADARGHVQRPLLGCFRLKVLRSKPRITKALKLCPAKREYRERTLFAFCDLCDLLRGGSSFCLKREGI